MPLIFNCGFLKRLYIYITFLSCGIRLQFICSSYREYSSGNHNSEQMSGDSSLHSTSLLEDAHRVLILDAGCYGSYFLFCFFFFSIFSFI